MDTVTQAPHGRGCSFDVPNYRTGVAAGPAHAGMDPQGAGHSTPGPEGKPAHAGMDPLSHGRVPPTQGR